MPFPSIDVAQNITQARSRSFLGHVYNWMALGLALTAVVALAVFHSDSTIYWLMEHRMAFYGLLFLELMLVISFTSMIRRVSYTTALGMFVSYAALNGVTFSMIFLVYTAQSIASTFFIAAATFGGASVFGLVSKRDLTGVGHFLGMALWGIIVAIVVNLFLRSPAISYGISMIAVVVFVGLTAYDTQKLRNLSHTIPDEGTAELGEIGKKAALGGALMLYLDFINIFIHLLNLLGDRRR